MTRTPAEGGVSIGSANWHDSHSMTSWSHCAELSGLNSLHEFFKDFKDGGQFSNFGIAKQ
jgi:hypothetical protein